MTHDDRTVDEDTYAVLVGDQILVFPGSYRTAQCVAASGKSGRRCRDTVDSGGASRPEIFLPGRDAFIEPASAERPDRCYWRQRCPKHVDGDEFNSVDPEWEIFDPDEHEALVKPVGPIWTPEGVRPDPRDAHYYREPTLRQPWEEPSGDSDQPRPVKDPGPTALYSYYDAEETPLYIGISGSLRGRERSHLRGSSWMDFVARSTVERFPTRTEAEAAERAAIKERQPLFNTMHNEGPEAAQRLVEYLMRQGRADLLTPAVSRG